MTTDDPDPMPETDPVQANWRLLTVDRTTSTGHRLLEYDGVCGNIHGHNLRWTAELGISMAGTGPDNMPLDLKDISDAIDRVDHAVLLNEADPLVGPLRDHTDDQSAVLTFPGDPTCEAVAQWMADRLLALSPAVTSASVELRETDKYGIHATAVVPSADLDTRGMGD